MKYVHVFSFSYRNRFFGSNFFSFSIDEAYFRLSTFTIDIINAVLEPNPNTSPNTIHAESFFINVFFIFLCIALQLLLAKFEKVTDNI